MPFATQFPVSDIPKWSDKYSYKARKNHPEPDVRAAVQRRGYLTAADFFEVCYWKTPRTQSRCRENSAEKIRVLTQLALASSDEQMKMELLRSLQGVNWATASTIMHFCDVRPYPILDYRALWSLGYHKPPQYTMAFWLSYLSYVRDLALRTGLPIRTVDRALWQYSKDCQAPKTNGHPRPCAFCPD
jgi:hypothetical protein